MFEEFVASLTIAQSAREDQELQSIIDRPHLSPDQVWRISAYNFFRWRKKHDYPRILAHFSQNLPRFIEWQYEQDLNSDFLVLHGIGNFLYKNPHSDIKKYVLETNSFGKPSIVAYKDNNKKFVHNQPYGITLVPTKEFIGYFDWCDTKGIVFQDGLDNESFFKSLFMNGAGCVHNGIRGFDLLHVGGLNLDSYVQDYKGTRYLDFVNANNMAINGNSSDFHGNLSFIYSKVQNLDCENIDANYLDFKFSSAFNLKIANSRIQKWTFFRTDLSGMITNSELNRISIYSGINHLRFKEWSCYI